MIAEKYGDDRRTSIGYDEYDISMEDMIPNNLLKYAPVLVLYLIHIVFFSPPLLLDGLNNFSTYQGDSIL